MMPRSDGRPQPVEPTPLLLVEGPNVAPLLGVLLVILVSFMSAFPVPQTLDVSLPIDVTLLSYRPTNGCDDVPVINYGGGTLLTMNQQTVTHEELARRLSSWMAYTACKDAFIIAKPDVPYGEVARLVDIAKGSGVRNVVMVPQKR